MLTAHEEDHPGAGADALHGGSDLSTRTASDVPAAARATLNQNLARLNRCRRCVISAASGVDGDHRQRRQEVERQHQRESR